MVKRQICLFLALLTPGLLVVGGASSQSGPAEIRFTDVSSAAGIEFEHFNAASPARLLIETMGSGCAWIDYDGDGLLDAFLVNGGPTPEVAAPTATHHALLRNRGDGTFENLTTQAGVQGDASYGMGAAVADYDNDGDPDLFLSAYPHSLLYRNNSDGTFSEVGSKAGVRHEGHFASSAGWFDYDRDGDLDLLVLNFVSWSYEDKVHCSPGPGYGAYCDPQNFRGTSATLYRNNGDGTFSNHTAGAGLKNEDGKGLGLVLADFDEDGWTDVYLANDGVRNFYYRNKGDGTFDDMTYTSGLGFSEDGVAEASMGTDATDYDGDGLLDLFVAHLDHEQNRLYRNLGNHDFDDVSTRAGLAVGLNLFSGFGSRFTDLDRDGWSDLVIVNGHVIDNVHLFHPGVTYREEMQIYRNRQGRFENISEQVGGAILTRRVGRGLALGDYDNDGDFDLLISSNGGKAELLRNDSTGNHWIGLKLVGNHGNRDAVGARVEVQIGGRRVVDQLKGGTSYLSSGDSRLLFGLGSETAVERVVIHWPAGHRQVLEKLPGDRYHTVHEPAPSQYRGQGTGNPADGR